MGTGIWPEYTNDPEAGIAQWIERKLRNHDPMKKHDKAKTPVSDEPRQKATGNEVIYTLKDGRRFKITVEELPAIGAEEPLSLLEPSTEEVSQKLVEE